MNVSNQHEPGPSCSKDAVYTYTSFSIQPVLTAVLYNKTLLIANYCTFIDVHPVALHPYKNYLL
jgi:hypothetical protein